MTGGNSSRPVSLEGPYKNERSRLEGTFTDADRQWRKQWLKDQELSHHEPRPIPESQRYNPIRRFYRFPLNYVFAKLEPTLGRATQDVRYWTGKAFMIGFGVLAIHYYLKYNSNDWTRVQGWKVYTSRAVVYPGDPDFGKVSVKKPSDYADYGFKNSNI